MKLRNSFLGCAAVTLILITSSCTNKPDNVAISVDGEKSASPRWTRVNRQ